ncbi:MAG: metallophosphoesterase [Candidatus Asgardarchaeia archaeon]
MLITFELLKENGILLKTKKNRIAIVSDLHLGFELGVYEKNVAVPFLISRQLIKDLKEIIIKYSITTIIFLGDIKDSIFGLNYYEKKLLNELLETIMKHKIKYYFIKGNHDAKLTEFLKESKYPAAIGNALSLFSDRITIFHGHYFPKAALNSQIWVTSHIHPAIRLPSSNMLIPVFLLAKIKRISLKNFFNTELENNKGYVKIYVIPPFNRYLLSNQLQLPKKGKTNNIKKRKDIYDLIKRFPGHVNVYLNDGTYLGKLDLLIKELLSY